MTQAPASPALPPGPTRRRIPRQARARRRVDELVTAAERLVERLPLDRITAAAIADEAGVPIGSLYQYFRDAMSVLAELARRRVNAVDDETVREIAGCHHRPWTETVDHVIDTVLRNFDALQDNPTSDALMRIVNPTPEFRLIAAESNARVARALAAHPALARALPEAEQRWRVARAAVEAGTGLQAWALEPLADDHPVDREAIAAEMKTLMKAYLGHYLETP